MRFPVAQCVNGCVVVNLSTGFRCAANDVASIQFAAIPDAAIDEAIARGSILTSAGGFSIRDPSLAPYVAHTNGTPDAIEGLPLATLRQLLLQAARGQQTALRTASPSGTSVRVLQPSDEPAARRVFSDGMRETISGGLRAELLRPSVRATRRVERPHRAPSSDGVDATNDLQ